MNTELLVAGNKIIFDKELSEIEVQMVYNHAWLGYDEFSKAYPNIAEQVTEWHENGERVLSGVHPEWNTPVVSDTKKEYDGLIEWQKGCYITKEILQKAVREFLCK